MNVATVDGHKERFIKLLHELFQLDKPELDFGLYRIMHAKSDQLSRFIREDLAQAIEDAFAEQGEQQLAAMRQEIEEKRRQAEELGAPDPDSAPAVKQARADYDVAKREQNASADIYDHLYRFFSRYYDKGDFMSCRHHVAENDSRAAPYAVPYDGREVYLHWANKDQYYVKSSETLANFTFNLNEALKKLQGSAAQAGLGFDSVDAALKVHCRVVDATEGEHNDVKESTERFFIIHHEEPVRLEGADLVLQFEYRPDPEKTGQSGTWQKKRLEEAEDIIMAALRITDGVAAYRDGLATRAPTDKQKERTLLGKYLQQYTARNTMDYFIHKDLGGFLSRELDFYIKNEILHLDDIDNAEVLVVDQQLKKIQVLRKIAKQIITFLAQLENFQKKLWLKKKFVTEAEYCITLDYLEGYPDILSAVFRDEGQRRQWEELCSLDLARLDQDLQSAKVEELVHLGVYRFLMVDTSLVNKGLKEELVATISGLDASLFGVCINSENSQAISLTRRKFEKVVKFVYIDPPYNTGKDGFAYKDSYQHSSWLSMAYERVKESLGHLADNGSFWVSSDDTEGHYCKVLGDEVFGRECFIADFIWKKRDGAPNDRKVGSINEHIFAWSKNAYIGSRQTVAEDNFNLMPRSEKADSQYRNFEDPNGKDPRGGFRKIDTTANAKGGRYVESLYYPIKNPFTGEEVLPRKGTCWRHNKAEMERLQNDNRLYWGVSGTAKTPMRKLYKTEARQGMATPTVWDDVGYNQHASNEGEKLFGVKAFFDTPKPTSMLNRIVTISSNHGEWAFDFFAGSGSLASAVINESRISGSVRNYLLVEVGGYFDEILKPRIIKSVYASEWKDGSPKEISAGDLKGISHAFKYLRLESYDDTLNNLELDDNPQRDALMEQNPELRRDYTLKYLLDVETRGSASLLNTEWFRDPEGYTLKVKQPGSDETRETAVDLVETFNWLIGLHVTHLDKPRTYIARFKREEDPELPEDQNTRLKAEGLRENEDGAYWIRQVEGHVRRIPGSDEDLAKVLVVWRKLTDDPERDAAVLEALLAKYKIGTTDSEFDAIYINGPHGLNLTGSARSRVHSLEEAFHARMWEGCGDEL
ncbi:MAG: DNA methyltransferase [Pseudomonadota bacterium]|jgi:adenine-specific DNA-methyltransferase|nr:DNA methyltransferase [Pseudomonadota bacterium]